MIKQISNIPPELADQMETMLRRQMLWAYCEQTYPSSYLDKVKQNNRSIPDINIEDGPMFSYSIHPSTVKVEHLSETVKNNVMDFARWMNNNIPEIFNYQIKRILALLLLKKEKRVINMPHGDHPTDEWFVFLYYVNDCDGDTVFFNDQGDEIERITPKKGTGVLFNANIFHAAENPTEHKARFVLSFLLAPPKRV